MLRRLSVSLLVVALVASAASAYLGFGDFQTFHMGLSNGILQEGDGSASGTNLGVLEESQQRVDDIRHTTAFQGFNGAITQVAGAVGMGGVAGAVQDGGLGGTQYQNPTTGEQQQYVGAGVDQSIFRLAGTGSVLGLQTALGIGTQLIFTPYGATANVQAIGDVVYDAAGGGPGGSTVINGGNIIGAGQVALPY